MPFALSALEHRKALRKRLRALRSALDTPTQTQNSYLAFRHLCTHPWMRDAQNIGFYLASDGEIQTTPWIDWAKQMKKQLYLPVIGPHKQMKFTAYDASTPLEPNQYGILEPKFHQGSQPAELDVLLMPLVGFDEEGNRLGMGGGYYDRLLDKPAMQSTHCIGLAHECQRVKSLPTAPWDKPIHAVATEKRLHLCRFKKT